MATNIKLKRSATQGAVPGTSDIDLGEIALNTYDGKMYMKKTVSGSSSIVELTGSSAPTSSAFAHSTYKYTASSNQTTFTGSDADSKTLSYTAGQIQVFLNGVLLDATDYTASNGSSVVLGSGASANDILYIISFEGTNPFDYFKYTATNAQTSFSGNDANSNSLIYTVGNIAVYLNGVLLDATDYTATTGTTVVLASGATTNDILVIYEFNETGLTDVASDTTPQLGGDLDVVTYDIVSTSNRNIDIIPHGTGNVNLGTDTVAIGTSGENVTITTTGTGDLTLNTNSGSSSGSILIADGANNDITITPNGTGDVIIDGLKYPQADGSADQVLKTDGSGQLSFTTISSAAITDADGDTKIQVEESSDEDTIRFDIAGTEQIVLADGVLKPTTDNDIDLGTSSLEFKDAFFDGTVTTDALTASATSTLADASFSGAVDANSTLNVSGHVSLDGSANELRFYEGANYVGFEAPSLSADQIWVLPTADGSSGQMLKTDGSGTLSWATASSTVTGLTDTTISSIASGDYLIYNGSAWVNQAQASNARIATMTGDNSDTTLTLPVAPLTENAVNVYWDGVYQHKDNWAISGTTLTFSTAPGTGVKVEAVVGSQTNILYGNDVAIDTMTGDASDTTLALSVTPSNENHVNVYFDGVYQSKSNFSLSGSTITFSTAPPTGVVVEAVSNQAVSVGTATGIAASALTGLSEVTAADADHVLIYDASGSALKKALVSDFAKNTTEEIQDIIGGMVSSNTESGITVAYQDSDGTLDFTVGTLNQDTTGTAATVTGAAQTNITSVGTLSALTISGDLVVDTDTLKVTSGSDIVHIGNTSTGFHSSVLPLIVGSGSGDEGMAIFSGSSNKGKIGFADAATDDSGSYRGYFQYDHNGDNLNIGTAGSEAMRITSTGNVGIGVAPESTYSAYTSIEFGQQGAIIANDAADDFGIKVNTYLDSGGNWKRKETGVASSLDMDGDQIKFFTAASGSADANISFAQKLRIDNDGIKFGSDTAAANALDDYEEGTFTPTYTVAGGGSAGTVTSTNVGTYTKVGNIVHCAVRSFYVPTSGTVPSAYNITLPFQAKNNGGLAGSGSGREIAQTGVDLEILIDGNQTAGVIKATNGAAPPANAYIDLSFTYQAA